MKRQIHQQLAARRHEVVRLAHTGRIQPAIASDLGMTLGPAANGTLQPRADVSYAPKTPLCATLARRTPRFAHGGAYFTIRTDPIVRQELTVNFRRMAMKMDQLNARQNEVVSACRITRNGDIGRSDQIFVDEKYAH